MKVTATLNNLDDINLFSHLYTCYFQNFHRFGLPKEAIFAFKAARGNVHKVFVYVAPLNFFNGSACNSGGMILIQLLVVLNFVETRCKIVVEIVMIKKH